MINFVPLSDCISLFGGGTPSKQVPEYWNGKIPWASVKDLKSTRLKRTEDSITELGLKNSSSKLVKAGTIIIATRMAVGKAAIADIDVAINQDLKAIVCKENIDVQYLFYFLSSSENEFDKVSSGATVKGIKLNHILDLKIPLPPLAEQKQIAAILDAADSLRQKDQQLVEHYTALSQSLFLEMFGDPTINPMGWDKVEFGTVGALDRGKSKHRPRNDPILLGGVHPLIQTGDIANSGGYITKYNSTYSDIGLKQSKKWKAGTLCITIAANIAKTGILTFEACFPDSVVGFINNEKSNTSYVQTWLSFLQKVIEDAAPMAAQKNINLKILRELEIPLPPIDLQNQFAERIAIIEQQKQQAQINLQKSEALFNSLLQRAFTGELTANKAA